MFYWLVTEAHGREQLADAESLYAAVPWPALELLIVSSKPYHRAQTTALETRRDLRRRPGGTGT